MCMCDDVDNKRDLRGICSGYVNVTVLVQGRVQLGVFELQGNCLSTEQQ
jgi:hypothetical protein